MKIGPSDVVLDWLQNGIKYPISDTTESFEFPNTTFSNSETAFSRSELQSLLLLGHIDLCDDKPFYVSPITCVPKKKGDFRLITELGYINKCSTTPKLKNEDINTVIDIVKPKDYMITTDLKNGFFLYSGSS